LVSGAGAIHGKFPLRPKRITFYFIAECSFIFGSESANRGRFLSFI